MTLILTKAEYRSRYPNATVCPEHDSDDQAMIDGVCYYCVCGCDLCEGIISIRPMEITMTPEDKLLDRERGIIP